MNVYILQRHIDKNWPHLMTVSAPGVVFITSNKWVAFVVVRYDQELQLFHVSFYSDGTTDQPAKITARLEDYVAITDFMEQHIKGYEKAHKNHKARPKG